MRKSFLVILSAVFFAFVFWKTNTNEMVLNILKSQTNMNVDKTYVPELSSASPSEAQIDFSTLLHSGTISNTDLDSTWDQLLGDSAGLSFSQLRVDRPYRLAAVAGEYLNLADNPLRILITHSWKNFNETTITNFNREIDGIEEASIRSNIFVPATIESANESQGLALGKLIQFETKLNKNIFSSLQTQRPPDGSAHLNSDIQASNASSPILEFALAEAGFEQGQYNRETLINGQPYNVQLVLRQPNPELLTMEIQIQEVGSLQLHRYALVYKKQNNTQRRALTKLVSK